MPATTRLILANADLEGIVEARRRNYDVLSGALMATGEFAPVRRSLSQDACPWAFPVVLSRRAERDYLIRASGVPLFTFGEVLHPTLYASHGGERAMLETAEYLSNSLLAISVHQGIERIQVERFAALINNFIVRL
jgi:dTDP-4-amino-4,6-dideoxygalactose transaminase